MHSNACQTSLGKIKGIDHFHLLAHVINNNSIFSLIFDQVDFKIIAFLLAQGLGISLVSRLQATHHPFMKISSKLKLF